MLVLTQRVGEAVVIRFPAGPARELRVNIVRVTGGKVRVGYQADPAVKIDREVIRKAKDAVRVDGGEG